MGYGWRMPRSTRGSVDKPRGAVSHEAIIQAVYDLLQHKSVRDLTIEAVAARAGVGKPTIYRWWKTKYALVLAMLRERFVPALDVQDPKSLEDYLRTKVGNLIDAFNGFFGKCIAELVAEGQSEPDVLRELNDEYVRKRRAITASMIQKAQVAGDFPRDVDPELVVDALFGSIYYQLLLKLRPLTRAYGEMLVDQIFCPIAARQQLNKSRASRR